MLCSAAQNMQAAVINLTPDDYGSGPDVIGSPEYSRVHRPLFNLNLYFRRLSIRHRSNALQKSVADCGLQILEFQSVAKMQLRE